MIRISVILVGIALVCTAFVIARRPRDDRNYGGAGAFVFHVLVTGSFGGALILVGALTVSAELMGFLFMGLGAADVVVGIVSRRRHSVHDRDIGRRPS